MTHDVDQLLQDLHSRNKRKRTYAVAMLGKAKSSHDRILDALHAHIERERDPLIKAAAESSVRRLEAASHIRGLLSGDAAQQRDAMAHLKAEQLANEAVRAEVKRFAVGEDASLRQMATDLMQQYANILKDNRQEAATRARAPRQERVAPASDYNWTAVAAVPVIALFVVGGIAIANSVGIENQLTCAVISAALGVVAVSIPLMAQYEARCPSCSRWGARREQRHLRTQLNQRTGFKTVTRTDTQYNSRGEKVGEIERREQVRVLQTTYRNHYKCAHCGHTWSDISTEESEDFLRG